MEQLEMTEGALLSEDSETTGSALTDETTAAGASSAGADEWQQATLLPATTAKARPVAAKRPNERLRQAGLRGIAQARAALEDAARRAREAAETRRAA
jgi:hypothetical protein